MLHTTESHKYHVLWHVLSVSVFRGENEHSHGMLSEDFEVSPKHPPTSLSNLILTTHNDSVIRSDTRLTLITQVLSKSNELKQYDCESYTSLLRAFIHYWNPYCHRQLSTDSRRFRDD